MKTFEIVVEETVTVRRLVTYTVKAVDEDMASSLFCNRETDEGFSPSVKVLDEDSEVEWMTVDELDLTPSEYEVGLREALLEHSVKFPGHVFTVLSNGRIAHFCEAAALDMFDTRREALADLIATVAWENAQ